MRTGMTQLNIAGPSAKPVAWFKHGPYEDGEPLLCVFEDPRDDICYSALYAQNTLDAAVAAESEACEATCRALPAIIVASLTDDQRLELFASYCRGCGRALVGENDRCYCMNDE